MAKKLYLVLDCETATLPFANEIAQGDADRKKKIAIARPLIYDIGWVICDRKGEIYNKKQFLIAETFAVPSVFNTAYYAEKRPIYLEMLQRGEITIKPWQEVVNILIEDMNKVDSVGAFNSMFDFKKAIPFTDLYVNKLYSPDYFQWEKIQRSICVHIVTEITHKNEEKEFEADVFKFHGVEYKLFDLWGLSVEYLLNNVSYKKECLNHGLLTNSGLYFKTSAESTYLCDKYDFVEAHTALDDATIETFILSRIAARGSVKPGIKFFPFRDLGYTDEFCLRNKKVNKSECFIVYSKISDYLEDKEDETSAYITMMFNKLNALAAAIGI
mgnify:CR=1 FL=1